MSRRAVFLLFLLAAASVSIACRPVPSDRFAIYLLAEDSDAPSLADRDLGSLPLQDQPLLSSDDFISYRAETHEVQLQASTCQELQQALPQNIGVRGVPFVVCVGSERIYAGAFWTPLSSLSFDGVVILQPCMMQEQTMRIELGYPSERFFTGHDPRSDRKILSALRAAGKLE
jgi:hypothetical protein